MMREIKFRGKRIDNGKWIYGSLIIEEDPIADALKYFIKPFNFLRGKLVAPETVGQYTGRKDKNNKEIYEGDIVKLDFIKPEDQIRPAIGIVKWEKEYTAFVVEEMQSGKYGDGKYVCDFYFYNCPFIPECEGYKNPSFYWEELEVIGNIYDNPELLEEIDERNKIQRKKSRTIGKINFR